MTNKSIFQKSNVLLTNILLMGLLFIIASCNNSATNNTDAKPDPNAIQPPVALNFDIVKTHPHDTTSYTEGLEWDGII